MVLRTVGASLISRLMKLETAAADSDWLLFGPSDPDLVEPEEPAFRDEPWLLAAE